MVYQVSLSRLDTISYNMGDLLCFSLPSGVFSSSYEDVNTGRTWHGVTQYSLAVLVSSDTPSDHRTLVRDRLRTMSSASHKSIA